MHICNKKYQAGITLVEMVISMLIIVASVTTIYATLGFVSRTAKRSADEAAGNMQAVRVLELITDAPYNMVTTNNFPIEYEVDASGELVYALTTSVQEVTSPDLHKRVTIDYTWREDTLQRHTRYYILKSD